MKSGTRKVKIEFGDFQTPPSLSQKIAEFLYERIPQPNSIVEPTCGKGNLLFACLDRFPGFKAAMGLEIQASHWETSEARRIEHAGASRITVRQDDFFGTDWKSVLEPYADPILVVGNPPWVTNSDLSSLGSTNLPAKGNFDMKGGMDALTGKSNFDISEAMLIRLVDVLCERDATLAVLCKTNVARKIMVRLWNREIEVQEAEIRRIDAGTHFDAAVDACLFFTKFGKAKSRSNCPVFGSLTSQTPSQVIGFQNGSPIADCDAFEKTKHLLGTTQSLRWRSGIKHDCSGVMELNGDGSNFFTQLGERVELESEFVFPMLKASDVSNGRVQCPRRWMIVTQKSVGEETCLIAELGPKTWAYLQNHAVLLDRRASSIYRNKPRFAIFGVGPYSFAPWKVAIAALYKNLSFNVVPPYQGRPVVLDDTCNFLPCENAEEAELLATLLNSSQARDFYSAFVFWDAKRPITVDLLQRLDIRKLADDLGREKEFSRIKAVRDSRRNDPSLWYHEEKNGSSGSIDRTPEHLGSV